MRLPCVSAWVRLNSLELSEKSVIFLIVPLFPGVTEMNDDKKVPVRVPDGWNPLAGTIEPGRIVNIADGGRQRKSY